MACKSDADDPFDSLLFLEEKCQAEGYTDGYEEGRKKGLIEGYNLGAEKGREIGSEIGFYEGFVETWLEALQLQENTSTNSRTVSRKLKVLHELKHSIGSLSMSDPTDERVFKELEKIRAKFKQLCSLLGISVNYKGQSQPNQGESF